MRCRRIASRNAFTLIELVASALLTALMLVALISVVWSAAGELKRLKLSENGASPATWLIDQMRVDFQNARGMGIDRTGVTLYGFLRRHPNTDAVLSLTGQVRYEIRPAVGSNVLWRRTDQKGSEAVWIGIGSLSVEPLSIDEPEDAVAETGRPPTRASVTGGLDEIPSRFRVMMLSDRGETLWREVVHHHES